MAGRRDREGGGEVKSMCRVRRTTGREVRQQAGGGQEG